MAPKYCTLTQLKQYLMGTRTDPNNPTVYSGTVTGTPDDTLLTDCIYQAEAGFEMTTGTGYDAQTYAKVQSALTFVDGNGVLHLYARERGPVTAVTLVELRDFYVNPGVWKAIAWDASDGIILPPYAASDTHPRPESWHVQLFPSETLMPYATGELYARWSYTGGYASIPNALSVLVARYATYIYKLREAPIGQVSNLPLGTLTVPADVPPDLQRQFRLWSPVYA